MILNHNLFYLVFYFNSAFRRFFYVYNQHAFDSVLRNYVLLSLYFQIKSGSI